MIDDGSPDGTLQIAEQLQEIYGEDKIVSETSYFCGSELNTDYMLLHDEWLCQ